MKILAAAALGLVSVASLATVARMYAPIVVNAARAATPGADAVDANGNLRVPANYRTVYKFLGGWAVAADQGQGAKQVHVVYTSPGTIEAYRKTGHFPDGSVLVKEVFDAATASMTTGTVSHAQSLKGWFVMVADGKNDHRGSKLWGDGWGWSWFDAGNRLKTTSVDYKVDCQSCHIPARATDWIYIQGYPALAR